MTGSPRHDHDGDAFDDDALDRVVTDASADSLDAVRARFDTDVVDGLSVEEAARRGAEHGENRLTSDDDVDPFEMLREEVVTPVSGVLLVAAIAGAVIGEWVEALAVLVALGVNVVVGFVTKLRAQRSMSALAELLEPTAEVLRGGQRREIDATGLVPGDIVVLDEGDRTAADLRLVRTEDLRMDESSLTGESETVTKTTEAVDADAALAERSCMAFTSTTVVSGRGRGIVVAIGDDTEVGRVAELTRSADETTAPVQSALDSLASKLIGVIFLGTVALVVLGLVRGDDLRETTEVAIALGIAVVPEGLPAVATLTLAIGMRRMAARNALVRTPGAVETLGSTTVLCTDKTGTLTENRMELVEIVRTGPVDDASEGDEAHDDPFWVAIAICNDADIGDDDAIVGDPTEAALLRGASERWVDWHELRRVHPRDDEIPFTSERMFMAVRSGDVVYVKGAPERLLAAVSGDESAELGRRAEELAERGLRTLAIATAPPPIDDVLDDLTLLGLVGLEDPPRGEAIRAVDVASDAGVRMVMITGDRPDTAAAIAARLGIETDAPLTGSDIDESDELAQVVGRTDVFARVTPEQKLDLVVALQEAGEVVAMTGDGVNDAPSLSQADIGIAMGGGTDMARQAADVVFTDDDIGTLEAAIAEGRRVFDNIRSFAQFLFSWHVSEVLVIVVSIVLGTPAPLTALVVLWNNLVIDIVPSFALALEPGGDDVMERDPRPPGEPVITRGILRRIVLHGALVGAVGLGGFEIARRWLELDLDAARAVAFVGLSGAQTFHQFDVRRDTGWGFRGATGNPWLFVSIAVVAVLTALAVFTPLSGVLGLAVPSADGWFLAAVMSVIPVGAIQSFRVLRQSLHGVMQK